ncbi:MAG: hypothetical protein JWP57_271 [Spirosoma sp.]|nr:hypothetical protein [Spirosoma sp.]
MNTSPIRIHDELVEKARKQVARINERAKKRAPRGQKPTKITLTDYMAKALTHYLELDYDPLKDEDKNPLRETILRTTDRIIAYLQTHERWYMDPVKEHLERVENRMQQQQAVDQTELARLREISTYAYLTSDLVLNLMYYQYKDDPDELARLQAWGGKRYEQRYAELITKQTESSSDQE